MSFWQCLVISALFLVLYVESDKVTDQLYSNLLKELVRVNEKRMHTIVQLNKPTKFNFAKLIQRNNERLPEQSDDKESVLVVLDNHTKPARRSPQSYSGKNKNRHHNTDRTTYKGRRNRKHRQTDDDTILRKQSSESLQIDDTIKRKKQFERHNPKVVQVPKAIAKTFSKNVQQIYFDDILSKDYIEDSFNHNLHPHSKPYHPVFRNILKWRNKLKHDASKKSGDAKGFDTELSLKDGDDEEKENEPVVPEPNDAVTFRTYWEEKENEPAQPEPNEAVTFRTHWEKKGMKRGARICREACEQTYMYICYNVIYCSKAKRKLFESLCRDQCKDKFIDI